MKINIMDTPTKGHNLRFFEVGNLVVNTMMTDIPVAVYMVTPASIVRNIETGESCEFKDMLGYGWYKIKLERIDCRILKD